MSQSCFVFFQKSKVLDSMYDMHSGIKLSNLVEQGSTYSNCFSGEHLKQGTPLTFCNVFQPHTNCKALLILYYGCAIMCDPPTGSAVVDWLVFMQLVLTRVEAVTLASALLEEGFLRTVGQKSVEALRTAGLSAQFMDDSTALYSFVCSTG